MIVLEFFLFLFVATIVSQEESQAVKSTLLGEIYVTTQHDALDKQLDHLTADFFDGTQKELVYESDVYFDHNEFVSLVPNAVFTTREELRNILVLIAAKNKFETVSLQYDDTNPKRVLLILKSYWTFGSVRFKGRMIGKDRYRNYYFLEMGERWYEENHARALEAVKEALYDDGYYGANVISGLQYDQATKTVNVTLTLEPGKRFTLRTTTLKVTGCDTDSDTLVFAKQLAAVSYGALHGLSYSSTVIDEHRQFLENYCLESGFFDSTFSITKKIDYVQRHVIINIDVTVAHKKKFNFLGNKFFTKQQLFDAIKPFGQSVGFIPAPLLGEELAVLYKKKGFHDSTISWQDDDEQIFFFIHEGCRSKIGEIIVEGAQFFSSQHLNKILKSFKNCYRDQETLRALRHKILEQYQHHGFWDAEIIKEEYRREVTHDTVVLTINEKEQRFLKKISFKNLDFLEDKEPFTSWNKELPLEFNNLLIGEQRQKLTHYLTHHGYLYTFLKPTLLDNGSHLCWEITGLQEPVIFGKTVVSGSVKNSSLVLRELIYKEGDIFDKNVLEKFTKQLKSLDIFESVSLVPLNREKIEPQKTMLLTCIEDRPFEVRTRFGVELVGRHFNIHTATPKLGGSFLWKNPTGRADILRIDGDYIRFLKELHVRYSLPWLGHFPIKTDIESYILRYDQPFVKGSKLVLYKASQDGFQLAAHWVKPTHKSGINVGAEWIRISDLSPELARKIDFEPRLINKKIPYLFAEPTLLADYRDNKVQPTRGSFSVISLKGMLPVDLKKAFFIKILAEHSLFLPVYDPVVMVLRFRIGHIFNQCFSRIMPIERFFLGGSYSIRGYKPDLAPPLNCFTDSCGKSHVVPIGGRSLLNINFELRFPLYKNILGGVIFTDVGGLAQDKLAEIRPHNLLGASGFGLRCNTPVGPLRFDIGFKWHKSYPQEHSFAWFLTLGNPF